MAPSVAAPSSKTLVAPSSSCFLPVVDLVRVDPKRACQLGDGPVAFDGRQRHLRLEPCAVLFPCPLHVLLPRSPRFLGAGLHLSHLSHFRGPAHRPSSVAAATAAPETGCCVTPLLNRDVP